MSADTTRLTLLMADAVETCVRRVESGGVPFVGLLVTDDGWVSDPGVNLVHETGDPTAHAEIVAWGFDYRGGYDADGTDALPLAAASRHLPVERALAPFLRYTALHRDDFTHHA
ncbi:hypothetical protein AB0H82_04815 [Streptomyces sp. NPDC050732]|uniref:hypothetical protein n=1 Tax=Streptomyces sp. NPDC050732 TaxID=3154632 RepID=UPI00342C7B40